MTSPTANIDDLRLEIDELDAAILAAVKRRTEVSRVIGKARMASAAPELVHSREMKVIERYSELGPEGKDLAMLLLRLGRRPAGPLAQGVKAMYLVSRYSSMPSEPPSRPNPDSLMPPNGAAASEMTPRFTPTMPASTASATRSARSSDWV